MYKEGSYPWRGSAEEHCRRPWVKSGQFWKAKTCELVYVENARDRGIREGLTAKKHERSFGDIAGLVRFHFLILKFGSPVPM